LNTQEEKLTSSNVLAYIEGSDPVLSKEVVIITAHYDHIGVDHGVVYNGADDDGTGTVALLELAEAFMEAKKNGEGPKRSVLIMPVSGEEKGLLGSDYYSSHPVIPLENTVADLNIDMIGRNDIAHEKDTNYIYIIGSNMLSNDLHDVNERANNKYTQLKLDYKFNSLSDPNQFYYRSDHYNFAKHSIPVIFYFSGVHEDYHQPTDDVEKIIFSKTEKVALLVFFTAWDLSNAAKRITLNR
jgi:Zn-dependent M28 family amino/carboxypeptidase